MDGSRRRLWMVGLVIALSACDPSPQRTQQPAATATHTATRAPSPRPTPALPSASPSAASPAPPTAVDLPAGYDAIPWADLPRPTGDEDSFTVSIGVLGRPATTTRTFSHQPEVWANGHAVLLEVDGSTEVVDAASGRTITTFRRADLELDDVPSDNLVYHLIKRFAVDAARGHLYLMSGNTDGMRLRRFDLDGTNELLLAEMAPDPGRDWWDSDFAIAPDGTVVATACPSKDSPVSNRRCRLYEIPPDATGTVAPRLLPPSTPRPCRLSAAGADHLVGITYEHCHADGGSPRDFPYVRIDLRTLESVEVHAPSALRTFGVMETELGIAVAANLEVQAPYPAVYPAIGVRLLFDDPWLTVDRYIPDDHDAENPGPYAGYGWAISGWGADWTLLHGFSPEYGACRLASFAQELPIECPSGPVILETPQGRFELPPGTWGGSVPPLEFPAL